MGIIRMTLLTVGVMGAGMMHFGRDDGLPTDRIGREPSVKQDTIVPVSAKVQETDASAVIPVAATIPDGSAHATPQVFAIKVAANGEDDSPAALAEAAAREMAANAPALVEPAASNRLPSGFTTMFVSGSTVNMRGGPSTQHGIVTKLTRGTEVFETGQTDDGWSQIKVVDTGERGFIASRFLKPQL
ncbi:SH3 domain-containing protein [Aliiroseovarius halocynthiae]|uniref:SH3 domain-containing protein n=1 Tax=Aliiroseovarius halocynthiae TaxID=985055 RepID=A0A545SMV7_9RHOB|nr:SH3 domain-containing protein [Aliiroseovarius halocynthiae]TQV66328.1 SH3 domain-containing protein [Aliiroseovarius halocynthiae]SMR83300.1 SH3 domain-containing protein [Aliiroseovarius halocynthiae]